MKRFLAALCTLYWLAFATPGEAGSLTLLGAGKPPAAAAGAAPGIVLNGEQPSSSTAATTTAANTLKSVSTGTLVIVMIDNGFSTDPTSVVDSAGNAYTAIGAQNTSVPSQKFNLYGAFITHAITSASTTFTVNNSGATSPIISVYDVPTAIAADLAGDGHAGNGSGGSTSWSQTIPTLNNAQEILLVGFYAGGEMPQTAPTGWTRVGSVFTGFGLAFYYKNATVTTSDTSFAGTFSGSQNSALQYGTYTR